MSKKKEEKQPSQVLVGTYQLGFRIIRLMADFSTANGCVIVAPEDEGTPQIVVGCGAPWDEVVGTYLHEAYELTFIDLHTRYKERPSWSDESSDFIFLMTHNQLSEACERVGSFVEQSLNDLGKVYSKRIKKCQCR